MVRSCCPCAPANWSRDLISCRKRSVETMPHTISRKRFRKEIGGQGTYKKTSSSIRTSGLQTIEQRQVKYTANKQVSCDGPNGTDSLPGPVLAFQGMSKTNNPGSRPRSSTDQQ